MIAITKDERAYGTKEALAGSVGLVARSYPRVLQVQHAKMVT